MNNNFNFLAHEFILNSPKFEADLSIQEIDTKHQGIVGNAYKKMNEKKFWENFRNWSEQSDGIAPVDFFVDVFGPRASFRNIARYIYTKIFLRQQEKFYLSSLRDDLEAIKKIGGKKFFVENKVSDTPGGSRYCLIDGIQINLRWARYIYLLSRIINNNLIADGDIWVDVGPFYGGLQGLVKKYLPNCRMVLVDFHHQLCRSYIYLKTIHPDSEHIFPKDVSKYKNLNDLPKNSFLYVPVSEFSTISNSADVDFVSNFVSLGEMRREHFNTYMTSQLFTRSKFMYLVNRFVSAPFFEKTYDSDITFLDYLNVNRKIQYFDIFPIHHYLLMNRTVLGSLSYRNISSSYFEIISKQND
jgi:putative sugar O-methyltransferase